MTGQVLDYSIQTNEGIISGDDSQRYRFAGADWPGSSVPTRGTLVDFDIAEGNRAVSIYLVEPIAPPAVPQQSVQPSPAQVVQQPVQTYQQPAASAPSGNRKDRTTAALLALFAGGLGIHKFYLGEKGGVLRIVLTCTGIGFFVSGILALMDALKLFQMSDADFDRQYNGGV